jgi:hypothetical protein
MGRAFAQRLVTQMYFPGDPLFPFDPIFDSVSDPGARQRMISRLAIRQTIPNWALAYDCDVCLRGPGRTPVRGGTLIFATTPSQTVGPFFAIGLPWEGGPCLVPADTRGAIRISAGLRWRRGARSRFADRNLAGRSGWSVRRSPRLWRQFATGGFRGFAPLGQADGDGRFEIVTVKPGSVPAVEGGMQATLLAQPADGGYTFDIRLQGRDETVFFAI